MNVSAKSLSIRGMPATLVVYGATHLMVDAVCAMLLFRILTSQPLDPNYLAYLFVLYNVLAFGLQAIFGALVDMFHASKAASIAGIFVASAAALIFVEVPVLAVILAGVGNALFHVGGGSVSLNLTPGKATAPGIFVAPGALGLMFGALVGKGNADFVLPVLAVMSFLTISIYRSSAPPPAPPPVVPAKTGKFGFEFAVYLILFVIAVRSLVGLAIVFPWKTDLSLLFVLTISTVFGKGLGGYLADRFGWSRIAVTSLAISIPFLIMGVDVPILACIGVFLFNVTMPVTLAFVSNRLPGRPGFAFGLTCLALIIGALPTFIEFRPSLNNPAFLVISTISSVVALYFGLRRFDFTGQVTKRSLIRFPDLSRKLPEGE
ncbi:MAG: hypothetical protein TUN42_08305 [Dehalogenimonas sp.]